MLVSVLKSTNGFGNIYASCKHPLEAFKRYFKLMFGFAQCRFTSKTFKCSMETQRRSTTMRGKSFRSVSATANAYSECSLSWTSRLPSQLSWKSLHLNRIDFELLPNTHDAFLATKLSWKKVYFYCKKRHSDYFEMHLAVWLSNVPFLGRCSDFSDQVSEFCWARQLRWFS